MVADVSSLLQPLNRFKNNQYVEFEAGDSSSTELITRNLVGDEFWSRKNDQVDLDSHAPDGWEKCLDLKTGKIHLQRSNTLSAEAKKPGGRPRLNLFDDSSSGLELNLSLSISSSSSPSSSNIYRSAPTLDKVKSALERAQKESMSMSRKRTNSPYSSSSFSTKEAQENNGEELLSSPSSSPVAVMCPTCSFYVMIWKENPECPKCNNIVPMPVMKKVKLDLNL